MQEIIFRQGSYYAKILADSEAHGSRLATLEVCMPRFILAEFNTHRDKSRNSASSRAIPVERRIEQVLSNPFVPEAFAANKSGMQAASPIPEELQVIARNAWLGAMHTCVWFAKILVALNVHKQWANRVIELWAWHTVVVSGTRWENMINLRTDKAAQPEMQVTAHLIKQCLEASKPRQLTVGQWHLPYISDEEIFADNGEGSGAPFPIKLSVVKCAAVSYERQDAERTVEQVEKRHDDMLRLGHWSPFEHAAKVASYDEIRQHALFRVDGRRTAEASDGARTSRDNYEPVSIGNFDVPWLQYRKTIPGEDVWHAQG